MLSIIVAMSDILEKPSRRMRMNGGADAGKGRNYEQQPSLYPIRDISAL
jgi:hypothetical protein